jgi:nitroreductase
MARVADKRRDRHTVPMELSEAMRTTGSVRRFRPDPVPLELIYRILDNARFAPSGANLQGWRVIVVTDPTTRAELGALFRTSWYGLHAPLRMPPGEPVPRWTYAEHIQEVPVHLVVLQEQARITTGVEALDGSRVVGGASVYPFVRNILLGVREAGLGSALTTVLVPVQAEVKALLGIPDGYLIAAHLTVGWPAGRLPTRLDRNPVEEFANLERFAGPPLRGPAAKPA